MNIITCTGPEFLQPVQATLSTGWQVDQCIDGNPTSGLCHSYPSVAPWLAIDYGTSVEIEKVEIFNRRDCCGDQTKNVEVRISNELPTTDSQMFSGGALLGHFSGPGTDGEHIVITGKLYWKICSLNIFSGRTCANILYLLGFCCHTFHIFHICHICYKL